MNHQLHSARLVEKSLEDDGFLRGKRAQRCLARSEIIHDLPCRRRRQSDILHDLIEGGLLAVLFIQSFGNFLSQTRHCMRKLGGARGCLAQPERDRRRLAVSIVDPHPTGFDTQNAIRGVPQLENVPSEALHREVFVDCSDNLSGRLEHHVVIGVVRNRAAGRERGKARPAPAAQYSVDGVAMDIRRAVSSAGAVPIGDHTHHVQKLTVRERRVGVGPPHQLEQLILGPLLCSDLGDDLLCEHVQRLGRNDQPVELAPAHRIEQRGAFDQLVTRQCKNARFRHAADLMTRPPRALQKGRDRSRRAQLAYELDVADVDPELERSGRD